MPVLTPSFKVWVAADETGADWQLAYTSTDLIEAATAYDELARGGDHVAFYERGRFVHGAKYVIGFVGIYWTAGLNGYMQREPVGRGHGWTEDYDTFVQYEPPDDGYAERSAQPQAEVAYQVPAPSVTASAPPKRYAEQCCQVCGVLAPMRDLHWLSHDVEVARTSGTRRRGSSHSTTTNSRGGSSTWRTSSSSTSGKRYYKKEQLLLCEDCYKRQLGIDRGEMVGTFFKGLFGI